VTIQVGIQALPTEFGQHLILSAQAWVCYPNTVAGGADASLVVSSMQTTFPSFIYSGPLSSAPTVSADPNYQQSPGFLWLPLPPWTPSINDFMDQSGHGGHCCVIANASGLFDFNGRSGIPIGQPIVAISELHADIDVCTDLYQGQRNIVIVAAGGSGGGGSGAGWRVGFGFLSGAPRLQESSRTTIAITAIDQGAQVDPLLLKVLQGGPYGGLPLKPASSPPLSLRLARHECGWNSWLATKIHEAEEIIEELLGLATHPFGGGHQLHLTLPAQGLQPLRVDIDLDPAEPPGTVHSIDISQSDANGARGGIRAGIVVT
jgi:hypothetical protein